MSMVYIMEWRECTVSAYAGDERVDNYMYLRTSTCCAYAQSYICMDTIVVTHKHMRCLCEKYIQWGCLSESTRGASAKFQIH